MLPHLYFSWSQAYLWDFSSENPKGSYLVQVGRSIPTCPVSSPGQHVQIVLGTYTG